MLRVSLLERKNEAAIVGYFTEKKREKEGINKDNKKNKVDKSNEKLQGKGKEKPKEEV